MSSFIIAAAVLVALSMLVPLVYLSRKNTAVAHTGKLKLGAVIVLVLASAGALYAYLGNRAAMDPAQRFTETGDVSQFVDAVTSLENKAKQHPDDLNLQVMLARSYRAMGRYEEAVGAYGRAWEAIKDDPRELTLFAGVLALFRGDFSGKPDELLARALEIDPKNPDALMLAGGSAFEAGHYTLAASHWEKALKTPGLEKEDKDWINTQIAEARKGEKGELTVPADPAMPPGHPPASSAAPHKSPLPGSGVMLNPDELES